MSVTVDIFTASKNVLGSSGLIKQFHTRLAYLSVVRKKQAYINTMIFKWSVTRVQVNTGVVLLLFLHFSLIYLILNLFNSLYNNFTTQ